MSKPRFCTPVAHQTSADYSAFEDNLARGARPYRQSFETLDPSSVDGLELFIAPLPRLTNLYVPFNGNLVWTRLSDGTGNAELEIDPAVIAALTRVQMIEAAPARIVFENIDAASFENAMTTLVTEAYAASNREKDRKRWHPSMKMFLADAPRKAFISMGSFIAKEPQSWTLISQWLTDYFANAPTVLISIPVVAGELIGEIAPYRATDVTPEEPPEWLGNAEATDAGRRLTVRTYDRGSQSVDPIYYLHHLFHQATTPKRDRAIEVVTRVLSEADPEAFAHPLVTLIPEIAGNVSPAPRYMDGQTELRIGRLNDFHGSEDYVNYTSRRRWRYADDALLNYRDENGPVSAPPGIVTPLQVLWNGTSSSGPPTVGDVIRDACKLLQVPCALPLAIVTAESNDPRDIRFEPLDDRARQRLRENGHEAFEDLYDDLVGLSGTGTITPNANGTATVELVLNEPVRLRSNLRKLNVKLRFGTKDRAIILTNTTSNASETEYTLTIKQPVIGGGAATFPNSEGTPLFYHPSQVDFGRAAIGDAEESIDRGGTLQNLVVTAQRNSAPTTVTMYLDGKPTDLRTVIRPKSSMGSNRSAGVAVSAGNRFSIAVASDGRNTLNHLHWELELTASDGDVSILQGTSAVVPDTWDETPVRAGHAITWKDVKEVIHLISGRVSPGRTQMLVATAAAQWDELIRWLPDVFATMRLQEVGGTPGELLPALALPEYSFLLGIAHLRSLYRRFSNRFDLPALACCYNHGKLEKREGFRYGLYFYDDNYLENAVPAFNAATAGFADGTLSPEQTVRFRK